MCKSKTLNDVERMSHEKHQWRKSILIDAFAGSGQNCETYFCTFEGTG